MPLIQRQDQRQHRVPAIRTTSNQRVAVDLFGQRALDRTQPARPPARLASSVQPAHRDPAPAASWTAPATKVRRQFSHPIRRGASPTSSSTSSQVTKAIGIKRLALARSLADKQIFIRAVTAARSSPWRQARRRLPPNLAPSAAKRGRQRLQLSHQGLDCPKSRRTSA